MTLAPSLDGGRPHSRAISSRANWRDSTIWESTGLKATGVKSVNSLKTAGVGAPEYLATQAALAVSAWSWVTSGRWIFKMPDGMPPPLK